MKKTLVIVFALHNDEKQEHVERLLQHFTIIAIAPNTAKESQWVLSATQGHKNYLTVPFPYTQTSIEEGVSKINQWERENTTVDGVMPISDTTIEYTAELIEALNKTREIRLRGMSVKTAKITRNKYKFRKLVAPVSKNMGSYLLMNEDDVERIIRTDGITFPALLKPAKGMGSLYVRRLGSYEELRQIYDQVRVSRMPAEWRDNGFVLEEFFEGDEVDVDGWACDGSVHFMLVNDDLPTGPPDFKELGGYYPSQLTQEKVEAIRKLTCDVVGALGDMHGAFHFEAKVNDELEVFAIEMNARAGGKEAPYAVEALSGYHLHTVHAQLATGQPVTKRTTPLYKTVASRNLYLDMAGYLLGITPIEAKKIQDFDVIVIRYLDKPRQYKPNHASESCVCWLAVGAGNKDEAEGKLKEIERLIEYKWKENI